MTDEQYSQVDKVLIELSSQINSLRWTISNMRPPKPELLPCGHCQGKGYYMTNLAENKNCHICKGTGRC